jgi:simple sugar transport system ATP-binding protein
LPTIAPILTLHGEIHALGENGRVKHVDEDHISITDEGEIHQQSDRQNKSPTDALRQGIGMIHQHFQLVSAFTVAENVALCLRSTREPMLDLGAVSTRLRNLSEQYGLSVDPNALVWQLAVGQQQRVEILKALYRDAALLILDEPTAVLTPQEVDELFVTLRRLVQTGHCSSSPATSARVMAISDRVTVLRDGRAVGA